MDAAIILGVILGVVAIGSYWAFRAGRSSAREDSAKAEAKEAFNEAQIWADRPRTLRDAAKLLRKRADLKRDEANLFR